MRNMGILLKDIRFLTLIALFCYISTVTCIFFKPAQAIAEQAFIKDIIVTNSSNDLLLYFIVEDCFSHDVEENIQNGLPVTFTFYLNLYQTRKGWPDKKISSHEFDRTLMYDSLKEVYNVVFFENGKRTVVLNNIAEAKNLMREVNGFKVASLKDLVPDEAYVLQVKARLAKKTLPLNFHYLIPFWSMRDVETDWYSVEFRY